jgi:hypothetical protein
MAKRTVCITVCLLLGSLATASTLNAAWQTGGTVVCNASYFQMDVVTVSDGAGGAIMAWTDGRNGSNFDIYSQRVSASGEMLWTTNGAAICATSNDQDNPRIVSDGSGGAIIVWRDLRGGSSDIYAQRISASGLVQWTANGVAICTASYGQEYHAVTTDAAGGAIIVWADQRGEFDIYAQRISASGSVLWPSNGVMVSGAAATQNNPRIASDGSGGAIIAWDDERGASQDIYAQRVDPYGTMLWDPDGIAICSNSSPQAIPDVTPDSAGGAVVVWLDLRDSKTTYYAQRVTPSGIARWTANGIPVFTGSHNPSYERLISDGADGAFVSIVDEEYFGSADLLAQRIDSAGVARWTSGGLTVRYGTVCSGQQDLVSDGTGGVFVVWANAWGEEGGDLYAQRIDANGSPLWTAGGVGVCTAAQGQGEPSAIADGFGGMLIGWEDGRNVTANDIYAQKVWRNGSAGLPAPSLTAVLDVPLDQGGKITLQWAASPLDVHLATDITHYSVWRRLPGGIAYAPPIEGKGGSSAGIRIDFDGRMTRLLAGAAGYAWEWIANVPAKHHEEYALMVESRYDSIGADPGWQYFVVSAHTSDPLLYFDSAIDSGYSVDNLSPSVPLGLAGEQSYSPAGLALTWDSNAESDLSRYAIYRGLSAGFVPAPSNRMASPVDASCFDEEWRWDSGYYYKVSALDVHGNESGYALLSPVDVTGGEPPKAPEASYLSQNYPNPFNPATRIAFGLSAPGQMSLRIYDVSGRLVRTLMNDERPAGRHEELWDGRDSSGRTVASGIYFCRLKSGNFESTRRMILLK